MKLVHICSYFNTSSLYKNLFEKLKDFEVTQEVFIPLYKNTDISPRDYGTVRQKEKSNGDLKYIYIECLSKVERFFLLYRVNKLCNILLNNINLDENSILHGHSLFANGGICYLVNKKRKCKYITAVRNTDLFIYSKFPFYRFFAKLIIKRAEKIVFISYSLKEKFLHNVQDKELKELIYEKGIVIPNGLSDCWFEENVRVENTLTDKGIKFIYQGTFHKRKNVEYIIKLIEKLNFQGINSELEIIGGGPEKDNLLNQIELSNLKNKITLKDWTNNFDEILKNYQRNSIFIMPSINETFGISYLEAMSVGLPIIYKQGDGIDGFFADKQVGAAISGCDLKEDVKKIRNVINNYEKISENTKTIINNFSWTKICQDYIKIYNKMS